MNSDMKSLDFILDYTILAIHKNQQENHLVFSISARLPYLFLLRVLQVPRIPVLWLYPDKPWLPGDFRDQAERISARCSCRLRANGRIWRASNGELPI